MKVFHFELTLLVSWLYDINLYGSHSYSKPALEISPSANVYHMARHATNVKTVFWIKFSANWEVGKGNVEVDVDIHVIEHEIKQKSHYLELCSNSK